MIPSERHDWRATIATPEYLPPVDLVLARAVEHAARPAVADSGVVWTYAELADRVVQVARSVAAQADPGEPVGLFGAKIRATIAALLGIMKSAAIVVPLDEELPDARVDRMLAASRVRLVVDTSTRRFAGSSAATVLNWSGSGPADGSGELRPVSTDAAAYIVFTSGTSGDPRGIVGWHAALAHFCTWEAGEFAFGPGDRVAQLASLSFDAMFKDVFPTLLTGGTLVLPEPRPYHDPRGVLEWLDRERITIVQTVPSVVASWVATGVRASLASVRLLCLAGEPLFETLVRSWRAAFPSCAAQIVNLYGPTEATILKSFHRVGAAPAPGVQPIGRPIPDADLLILGRDDRRCAAGEEGEIVIASPFLALGYLNGTADEGSRFGPNPFLRDSADRVYRTGDLGWYETDGTISIAGRLDDEVKILGTRVQPSEVAAVLARHRQVRGCAVLSDRAADPPRLHAFYEGDAEPSVLRTFLTGELPSAMVPSSISRVDHIPLTSNGKIDRERLRAIGVVETSPRLRPLTQTEELLQQLWSQLLRVPIDPRRDFFEQGGHSLLVIRAIGRIRQLFNVQIEIRTFFDDPTLSAVARHIDAKMAAGFHAQSRAFDRAPRGDLLPLSFPQRGVWFQLQLGPATPAYNMSGLLRIHGPVSAAQIAAALQALVDRHEALRTSIHARAGVPHQRVDDVAVLPVEFLDLSGDDGGDERVRAARQWLASIANRRFQFDRPPLARAAVASIDDDNHLVMLAVHHIVCDGWSWEILVRELAQLVETQIDGGATLPAIALSHVDHAWRHAAVTDTELSPLIDQWRTHLGAPIPVLDLPTDGDRPEGWSFEGAVYTFTLPDDVTPALRERCRTESATLYMGLFSGFAVLLARLSGVESVVVGTDMAGRAHDEFEDVVGLFADLQALHISLEGDPTYSELIGRVRAAALGAYARQGVPFERLIAALQPERSPNRTPLFQMMFRMAAPRPSPWRGRVSVDAERLTEADCTSKFDLTLSTEADADTVICRFEYRTDLYTAARIAAMADQYVSLLRQAVAAPTKRVSSHVLQSDDARLPDPREPIVQPALVPVTARFATVAASSPDRTAIRVEGRSTTYSDLLVRSDAVAAALLARRGHAGDRDVVAIVGRKDVATIARLCGVLRAGFVALPIDTALPPARQEQLARLGRARLLLGDSRLDVDAEHVVDDQSLPARSIPTDQAPDDPAYIFFTSGSTGAPKGILGHHKGIAHFVDWEQREFAISAGDRVAQITSFSFDAVLRDVFVPLTCGASVCLPPVEALQDPARLVSWLDAERVTVVHTTPSMFAALTESGADVALPSLRLVCLAGEPLLGETVRRWRHAFPSSGAEIVNFYGPTETTMIKSFHRVRAVTRSGAQPVGRPLPQTQLLVLGRDNHECGVGELGEITIRTPFAALGYIDADENARFATNPFVQDPGDRIYRTGDLGRYEPDGSVSIAGRIDDEVKIDGVRVHPAEVAAVLSSHPRVFSCVVMPEHASGKRRLVAYVVAADDAAGLRSFLLQRLPSAMVPSQFVSVERIPLTPNGKPDREALRAIDAQPGSDARRALDPVEQRVASIWAEVLGHGRFAADDDFFEHGGHSLLATVLASRLRRAFGVSVPLAAILRSPTIAGIAEIIVRGSSAAPRQWCVELRAGDICSYWVHPIGGGIACYRGLAAALSEGFGLRAFQAPGIDLGALPVDDPTVLADLYLQGVDDRMAQGPVLCGWSVGGLLACEMAHRARASGRRVSRLVMVDTYAPGDRRWPSLDDGDGDEAFIRDRAGVSGADAMLSPVDRGRLARVFRAHVSAVQRIEPRRVDVPITLFVAGDHPGRNAADGALGWMSLAAAGIDVVALPGDHYSVMQPPAVHRLAAGVDAVMRTVAAVT